MNKAISIFLLSLLALFYSCSQRFNNIQPKREKFEFQNAISDVFFDGGYFYILAGGDLYRYDKKTASLDSAYKVDLSGIDIMSVYINNGEIEGENQFSRYKLKNGKWKHLWKIPTKFPGTKIFEDNDYVISSICHGEWGGTLFFKNKNTRKVYETECTCAFDVQKQEDGYLVTSTLFHGLGHTGIFKIPNPMMLPVYEPKNFFKNQDMKPYHAKIFGKQGKIQIADSSFMGCLSKFNSKGKLNLIILKQDILSVNYGNKIAINVVDGNQLKFVKEITSEFTDKLTTYYGSQFHPIATYYNYINKLHNTGFIDFSDGKPVFYNFPLKK